jgi:hypothetical protein
LLNFVYFVTYLCLMDIHNASGQIHDTCNMVSFFYSSILATWSFFYSRIRCGLWVKDVEPISWHANNAESVVEVCICNSISNLSNLIDSNANPKWK